MNYNQIFLGIFICILGEFVLYNLNNHYLFFKPIFTTTSKGTFEKHEGNGSFTNPLLECLGVEGQDSFEQLNISNNELENLVSSIKNKYGLGSMGVYLRDLNNGPWLGINQEEHFIGGSLLKVPMLLSYLKLSETDPSILKKEIEYKEKSVDNTQYFTSSKQLEVGKKYTVQELLEYMIYYSDNNAAYLLSQNIDTKEFDKVFISLGLGEPDINKPYPVDTKTYASFFRVLFNASYLNKNSSEIALSMLSKGEFNKGLQSLIPQDLVVAHKFGIRSDGNVDQLHDCGIIYYPGHPYLLCIMSKGDNFEKMASSIGEVSKFVYDRVSKLK
ncbi:serine hydrolase [Patescibacteria group bacterium]|nr:serine hydrolase [Patescibacteria group bacterium]